jgi:hypothetical protein
MSRLDKCREAIATHRANFPNVWHECVDVTTINLRTLPHAHALWISPICTEASPAGGTSTGWRRSVSSKRGQAEPVDETDPVRQEGLQRTRATFWEAIRYAEIWRPELIFVENVPDVVDVRKAGDLRWSVRAADGNRTPTSSGMPRPAGSWTTRWPEPGAPLERILAGGPAARRPASIDQLGRLNVPL